MDVTYEVVDPRSDDAAWAMTQYFNEIDERFPGGFEPGDALTADAPNLEDPRGAFLVARNEAGEPIGCGGLQTIDNGIGELKRMWVDPGARGNRIGPRLLHELENLSRGLGHHTLRLDTNENLPEAIAMYERSGYTQIERYNDNPYPTHFFEKTLGAR